MAPKLRSTPWAVSLGLVLGGALGNLIDRIFRAPGFLQGHVVDFVSVFGPNAEYFPVFNVADSAITIGGISLVITALLGIDFDGTTTKSRKQAEERAQVIKDSTVAGQHGHSDSTVEEPDPSRTRCLRSAACPCRAVSPGCGPMPGWPNCSG